MPIHNTLFESLLWDCNARPHELCKLQIQHINFMKDKGYALGEIPYNTKTGAREIVLKTSFTYCRDWKNVHPYKDNPLAPFFCDIDTGKPLLPATIGAILRVLRNRIKTSLDNGLIIDSTEKEKLESFLRYKKWNPYCFRHSSITEDGETLPADCVDKKVGWVQGSRMRPIYMDRSFGKHLKNVILERDGIPTD
jgi:integrase/recombinase XerD